jgi:predicted O-linked N-acetylglucosamine transferase (SPINDLY family)
MDVLSEKIVNAMQVAGSFYENGDLPEAEEICRAVLRARANSVDALNLLGVITARTQRAVEAAGLFERAIAAGARDATVYNNYGSSLRDLGRADDALPAYERACALKADYAEAHFNRGNTLHELGRRAEALASYRQAVSVRPNYAEAHYNIGVTLRELERPKEALGYLISALEIKADYVEAHNCLGNALRDLGRFDEALSHFDVALGLRPNYAEAWNNRGSIQHDLRRYKEALRCYGRALQLRPDFAEAYFNQGNTLREMQRFAEALDSYARALEHKPQQRWLYGSWLHTKMQLCDWSGLAGQLGQLLQWIEQGRTASLPFFLLGLTDSLPLQQQAARIWVREVCGATAPLPGLAHYEGHEKIRVGYYSADFHSHATAYLAAELFERHDRERFELVAFSFGPALPDDPMRRRLSGAFDQFLEVGRLSDQQVAQLSRERQIDIAVDLKGFTQNERNRIFAYRAAPVQVSYLGYPGTLGAPYIDYLVADRTLIPESSREHYAEKIAYLPHSYQANDRQRPIAEQVFSRTELGLPEAGLVFCCFNNAYKITPRTFDSWTRILRHVEGSVLWLLEDSSTAAEHLRREAQARGMNPQRLVFAGRTDLPQHLARQRVADLFLDTLPCNAHTTASDALWAGLPVLTCMGDAFAARVAGSLLNAVGLPELITTSADHYEALAIELATQPQRLGALRARLAGNRLHAPLFDTASFTRHLEDAYLQMYQRLQQGLPPAHLFVEPSL